MLRKSRWESPASGSTVLTHSVIGAPPLNFHRYLSFLGVKTLWVKRMWVHVLSMDFSLSLLRLRLARFPCFGFYFCLFLPFLHHSPPLLVHSHQREGGSCCLIFPVIFFLEFCVRLHSQESSDFLITDDFWPLPHRNDPKLDFFPSLSARQPSPPLWPGLASLAGCSL